MPEMSGAGGLVGGRTSLSGWTLNRTQATQRRALSNTRGGMLTRKGIKDWNGTLNAAGGLPQVFPGDTFDFRGYVGPEEAYTPGGDGPVYSGTAIVDQVVMTFDWKTGTIISYTINFSGHGELVEETGSYEDLTFPDTPSSTDARLVMVGVDGSDVGSAAGENEELEVCGIETLTLTLTASNVGTVNSCSGGWNKRRPGTFDWNMSLVIDEASIAALPFEENQYVHFRIYIDDVRYWSLKWGFVKEFTNITVDRESQAIISQTIPIEMSSHTEDSADGIGHVRVPGHPDVDWWPKGEVGLEQLLNASFTSDSTWEEVTPANASITGGNLVFTGANTVYQPVWLEASKTYKVGLTASVVASLVNVVIALNSPSASQVEVCSLTAPGTEENDFMPAETGWYYFTIQCAATGHTVNSVSVKPYN